MTGARRFSLLCAAVAFSGAAALIYEILWVRRFGEMFGSTAHAIAVVLSIFFLGLGLGAFWIGKLADRWRGRIRLYIALEAVTGLYGMAFLPIAAGFERWYDSLAPAEWPMTSALAFKSLASIALLAVPTLAMGGTLPALVRHVVRRSHDLAPRLGWLYGINTLGGAAGCAIAVLVLIPRLGMAGAFGVAALGNLVALGLALGGRLPGVAGDGTTMAGAMRAATSPKRSRPESGAGLSVLMATAAASGFVAVGYEVLWARALASRFMGTVYSFAAVLTAFLVCLGLGSLLTAWLQRTGRLTRGTCAAVTIGAGLMGLISVLLLSLVPGDLAYGADPSLGLLGRERHELLWSLAVMLLPLLLFGLNFPLVARLAHREATRVGAEVGRVYLANTVGSVAAPLVMGLALLPLIGLKLSLAISGWLLIGFGILVLLPWTGMGRAGRVAWGIGVGVIALLVTLGLPRDLRLWKFTTDDRLIAYREGVSASIAVGEEPDGNRYLKIDNNYRLGDARTRFAQHRQGLIPPFLHPDPHRVLFIGMGTGSSAGIVAAWGALRVDVLEIIPELADMLPYFDDINYGLGARANEDSLVRVLGVDARHFVRTTDRRYDVVVGDLFVPWRSGEGAMFTREHFESIRGVLAAGGVFCQWLPLYQLRPEELRTITATFCDVFPDAAAYWLHLGVIDPVIGLVGSTRPLTTPLTDVRARIAGRRDRVELLSDAGLNEARFLLGSWIAGGEELREWSAGAPLETRDRPRIEFTAAVGQLIDRRSRSLAGVQAFLDLTRPIQEGDPFDLVPTMQHDAKRYQRGIGNYLRGGLASVYLDDPSLAVNAYAAAFLDIPESALTFQMLESNVRTAIASGYLDLAGTGAMALERAPNTAHLGYYYAAQIALARGDDDEAKRALGRALRVRPDHEESWELLREIEEREE